VVTDANSSFHIPEAEASNSVPIKMLDPSNGIFCRKAEK
jgi:hypothetical protein